jgi:predicted Zn-dependent protease
MRNIIKNTKCLVALGIVAAGAVLAALGCGSSGGSTDPGHEFGNAFGGMANAGSNFLKNVPSGGGGYTGNQNLDLAQQIGPKFFEAVDLFNPERQRELGQSCAIAISNQSPLYSSANANKYVNLVGMTVASACPKPELDYVFSVLDTPDINAYSTPAGYIFITRGALQACSDESELAAVLAHEIGHVVREHGVSNVRDSKFIEIGTTVASSRSREFQQLEQISDNFIEKVVKGAYSNEQEYQADAEAVKYLIAAGYDPNGLVRFLEKLQKVTGKGDFSNVMTSHPGTAERIKRVKQQIGAQQGGVTLNDRYAKWVK